MTDTKRAIAALEDGIESCPRVSVAAGAGPAFDCSCDKGLVTCASIIGKVAQALAAERERCAKKVQQWIDENRRDLNILLDAIRKGE
jgi:hypothetical protein